MALFTFLVCGGLIAAVLFQSVFAVLFARRLHGYRAPERSEAPLPQVSILLSLRGADPDMAEGLRRLMTQDYPNYDLRIIVDRETDPAWDVVKNAVRTTGFQHVTVDTLRERTGRCSLKNSALVQSIRRLDDKCEIIVIADGDLVAHTGWLREVVAPFSDPKVGGTTGAVWFWPEKPTPGSLVRALFISAAETAMFTFSMAWGGTVAIRTDVMKKTGLADKWSRAINEDQLIGLAMKQEGLRLDFVPGLTMVNREECNLTFILNNMKRQMTASKLYMPEHIGVLAHAIFTVGMVGVAFGLGVYGFLQGDYLQGAVGVGTAVFYQLAMLAMHALLESGVRQVIARRGGETVVHHSPLVWLKFLAALPLTQLTYLTALFLSLTQNHIVWRGVVYRIRGPYDIQIEHDQPFEQTPANAAVRQSL